MPSLFVGLEFIQMSVGLLHFILNGGIINPLDSMMDSKHLFVWHSVEVHGFHGILS